AFLVTADVPEIYMQELWATATVHQHSIRFKLDTRKHIVDLESFREMLHISPRILGQSFTELPFEEEILEFLRDDVLFSTIKVVLRHQTTQQYGAILPIELTTEDIRNSKAYKEYYACATGETAPKPKASARKKKGGSASSTTPPTPIATPTPTTTVVAAPMLSAATKGKQPARATSTTELTDVERTEAEQLKIVFRKSRQETHISQQRGFGTDEGTGSKPRVPDVPSDDSEEELSWNSFDDEDDEAEKVNDDDDDEEEISKVGEQEATKSNEGDDEATESDKESMESIFMTGSTTRRREDDDQEGSSAGSDWGSKRRREGGEHASASTPSEPATESAGRSTTSMMELEYHLEEVYKATTDLLDWVNPEGIMIEEPKPLKKKQQIEIDEEYARKCAKISSYEEKASNRSSSLKEYDDTKEQMEEEDNRALQSINETLVQKAAKSRKLNEEVEDLKRHLEMVPDEDDDVYTEATPLARKERFSTSKPKNFSDDFLLTTLGAMFEKPDAHAQVKKNQRTIHGQAQVKSWKLLESYGVHIITFTTTQLILLIERSAAKQKLMLLDNAAEARLMLLSHINAAKVKLMLLRQC
nr:hypothetical protein [Tanacetum cinerariifolium]